MASGKSKSKKRRYTYDNTGILGRFLQYIILAVFLTLFVEVFNQGSVKHLIEYITNRTAYFGINVLIIFTSLAFAEIFRRRIAVMFSVASIWVIFGLINAMCIRDRTSPFISGDMILSGDIVRLSAVYLSTLQVILIAVGAVLLTVFLVLMFMRTPRRKYLARGTAIGGYVVWLVLILCSATLLVKTEKLPAMLTDRVNAYKDYGFSTCFTMTFGELGVQKPDEYSIRTVNGIIEEVDDSIPEPSEAPAALTAREPNIIFVQLESFMDMNMVNEILLSKDPTPNWHSLLKNWPDAALYVPMVGGGTANVEFEVMSGMNMDFFNSGETPYSSLIPKITLETIASILRDRGYTTTAIHDNTGTFFSRYEVYANIGYDTFDSLEYMPDPQYTRSGWCKDTILTNEILTAIKQSDSPDLVFTIGVESHGKYAETYEPAEDDIEILDYPEELYLAPAQNYVNILRDVDVFIGELIDALSELDEPTVLVMYGDHLPGIGLTGDMLRDGSVYASHYLIWNNYGADLKARDMQSYRLGADILQQLGISDGVMMRFHQSYPIDEEGEEYLEKLQTLEYDLLYGRNIAGSAEEQEPSGMEIRMGLRDIVLTDAVYEYGRIRV